MSGYEKAQYLSQCYQNSNIIELVGFLLILIFISFLYIRRKERTVKGKKEKEQHTRSLQKMQFVMFACVICVVISVVLFVIPSWKDNRQGSFGCATGIYERDFPPLNWHKHPITITDDNGEVTSLHVAVGYFTREGLISSLTADEVFPEGVFRAKVYYGIHSGKAFYMERLP